MIDLITLVIVILVVGVIMIRRASAGVAILALLAGVLLDQLLATWIIGQLPVGSNNEYFPIAVRLIIGFMPVVFTIVAIKAQKQNRILSLLTSLLLGFLVVYFGLQIMEPIAAVADEAKKSGLFSFLRPYYNQILSGTAIFALIEMYASNNTKTYSDKKKKKKPIIP